MALNGIVIRPSVRRHFSLFSFHRTDRDTFQMPGIVYSWKSLLLQAKMVCLFQVLFALLLDSETCPTTLYGFRSDRIVSFCSVRGGEEGFNLVFYRWFESAKEPVGFLGINGGAPTSEGICHCVNLICVRSNWIKPLSIFLFFSGRLRTPDSFSLKRLW